MASMGAVRGSPASTSTIPTHVNPPFEYHRPTTVADACRLLVDLGPEALPLAGGTDVLVDLRRGSMQPRHLVSLADLEELGELTVLGGELHLGGMVTPDRMETSEVIREARPELLDAVGVFGSPQIRRRATVGGNLCTAASCGDLAPLLLVLGARVEIAGADGRRELPLAGFFSDHRSAKLNPGEILVKVVLPPRGPGEGAAYLAFGLRAENFITVAGVAVWLRVEDDVCSEARVALGAVAPTPVLVPEAEEGLVGRALGELRIREAARAAREAAVPITDLRGSAEHRRELAEALCIRAIETARERAR